MSLEFDHLFIFTPAEAPAADQLLALGLLEGTQNRHPGQGTINRRIFFHNVMLEFLWVENEAEVRSPPIRPTRLWERSRSQETGYVPFGLAFRPTAGVAEPPGPLPFETWAFRPPYLPPDLQIDVARNDAYPGEPLIFTIPFGQRPDATPPDRRQPLDHPLGLKEMTGLTLTLPPAPSRSTAVVALEQLGLVSFMEGDDPLATMAFDGEQQGQSADFRPALPLILRW